MPNASMSLASILPADTLPIGLGCSRLGSINGASPDESRALLRAALEGGVRFFDTSNIYGQGDSERLIAEVLGQRDDCVVCSKAGKYLDWKKRMLMPLKGALRGLAQRSGQARQTVAAARARPMPTAWEPGYLTRSLEASLRRLKRPRIEMFMLHSPNAEVLLRGDAMDALERAQASGKVGMIGVSVDDVDSAEAALNDPRVKVVQIPLRPDETAFDSVSVTAAAAGVDVIAREILGGPNAISGTVDPRAYAHDRIVAMIRRQDVAMTLIGTTRLINLQASIAAARAV